MNEEARAAVKRVKDFVRVFESRDRVDDRIHQGPGDTVVITSGDLRLLTADVADERTRAAAERIDAYVTEHLGNARRMADKIILLEPTGAQGYGGKPALRMVELRTADLQLLIERSDPDLVTPIPYWPQVRGERDG